MKETRKQGTDGKREKKLQSDYKRKGYNLTMRGKFTIWQKVKKKKKKIYSVTMWEKSLQSDDEGKCYNWTRGKMLQSDYGEKIISDYYSDNKKVVIFW